MGVPGLGGGGGRRGTVRAVVQAAKLVGSEHAVPLHGAFRSTGLIWLLVYRGHIVSILG